jgi:hypothetical protein
MSEFKDVINKKQLIETKTNLEKLRIVLEKKLEDQFEELVNLQRDLPHLVHLERISKISKERDNQKDE